MDEARYEAGLRQRKAVLGEEFVDKALRTADDFNQEFQELVTEYCWGICWGSEALSKKQRSLPSRQSSATGQSAERPFAAKPSVRPTRSAGLSSPCRRYTSPRGY